MKRMSKRAAVLGTGTVGAALAKGLKSIGYNVTIGSRKAKKVEGWDGPVETFDNALKDVELVVLAVKGTAAEKLVQSLAEQLDGKTVIDTTNPIADTPPVNGVISFFTGANESLMERLVRAAPRANFVKAFNSVGSGLMVKPDFGSVKPTMFICGNDHEAKRMAAEILDKLGWQAEDLGMAEAARPIESLCILWCTPAILGTSYTHALKLLKS